MQGREGGSKNCEDDLDRKRARVRGAGRKEEERDGQESDGGQLEVRAYRQVKANRKGRFFDEEKKGAGDLSGGRASKQWHCS